MGCFPACFGHWRHKETMKNVQDQCLSSSHELHEAVKFLQSASTESPKEEEIVNPTKLDSESQDKCEEEQPNKSNEEKADFDHSNVNEGTNELTSSSSDHKLLENESGEVEEEGDKGSKDDSLESKLSTRTQYSANHEIHDFLINDKDYVAVNSKEMASDCCPVQEESSESLFSLSIDSRKHVFAAEMGEKEVSSPLKKSDNFLVKTVEKTSLKHDEDKENIVPLSKDPTINQSFHESKTTSDHHQCKKRDSEIAVETSLSSWLVESEKSPQKTSIGNSPESEKNYGERGILGAIASPAEIKELSKSSSAGSTPCCSADDQLGIGTVGRYWRQRGLAGRQVVDVGSGSSCR